MNSRNEGFWSGVWATLGLLLVGWLCWLSGSTVSLQNASAADEERLTSHVKSSEELISAQFEDIKRRLERIEQKLDKRTE